MSSEDRRARLVQAGKWLREQRERKGFTTAAEFGRALDIDKGLVSNYETGRSSVPDDRAEKIAEVLGMDILQVRRNLGLWVPEVVSGRARADLGGVDAAAAGESEQERRDRIVAEGVAEARKVLGEMDPAEAEQLLDQMRTLVAGWRARRGELRWRRRDVG